MIMEVHREWLPLIKIYCSELFEMESFMEWLNNPEKRIATWHKRGGDPDDFSDVFMTVVVPYEGSDSDMPEEAWNAIMGALKESGIPDGYEAVIWLQND